MLEILIQLFGEFVLQAIGEVLLELGLHAVAEPFRKEANPWVAALGYTMFGAAFGGISLLAFPAHLTPAGALRIANLVLTPLVVGAIMSSVGAWRAKRGDALFRIDRFSYGFLFAFALAAVRFRFAT